MKLFLHQKICRALLAGLISLSLNTHAGILSVELDGDKLAKALDVVLEKRINQAKTGSAEVLNTSGTALMEIYYPQVKRDAYLFADHVFNEMRLAPMYGTGTALIVASIYMYQKALNDYFDTIDTKEEALQALRKKIKWKVIAGSSFLAVGIATLLKSESLAALCLGYVPKNNAV